MKALIPSLLALASVAPALETPLVIRPTGTTGTSYDSVLEISPNVGTMNLYEVNTSAGIRRVVGVPFLSTLDFLDKYIQAERKGVPFSLLRIGSGNVKPSGEEFLAALPNKPTAKEAEKKVASLQERAREAENNYWAKDHDYDGVVRAAWNGTYAMLCIPSKHALLFYETTERMSEPVAYMNYGPQLLIPVAYGPSNPTPQQVFSSLPPREKARLDDEAKKAEDASADTPAETPKSDAWVGAAQNNIFVLVDTANNMLMSYEFNGKTLGVKAVRNIKYDLMIPPRQNYKSLPDEDAEFSAYVKQRKRELAECGIEPDLYSVRALVAANTHGKAESTGLQANMYEDKVVLDFTQQHKLLAYSLSANSLDLASSRDYTLDLAITLMEQEIAKKMHAREAMKQAATLFKSHGVAMRLLKFALKLDPYLVDAVEKDTRLSGELKKEADWDPMIDQAHKDKDKADADKKKMKEAALKAKEADAELDKAAPKR